MEYNKIIAVTGLPGLFELLSSKSDGAIVRSLEDKSTRFVSSRIHNFSHLESIEIYTIRENVNLVDVLKAMEASTEKLPDTQDNAVLKAYFTKVYPDLDFDRVYSSDLKKMVKWFGVLKNNNIEIKLTEIEEEGPATAETSEVAEATAAPAATATEAPAKAKAPAKKAAAEAKKTATTEDAEEGSEKPKAKKPATRKKAADTEEAAAEEKPKKTATRKKS